MEWREYMPSAYVAICRVGRVACVRRSATIHFPVVTITDLFWHVVKFGGFFWTAWQFGSLMLHGSRHHGYWPITVHVNTSLFWSFL